MYMWYVLQENTVNATNDVVIPTCSNVFYIFTYYFCTVLLIYHKRHYVTRGL